MMIDPLGALAPTDATGRVQPTPTAAFPGGFVAILEEVRATSRTDESDTDPMLLPLDQLMDMVNILLLLGVDVPRGLLDQLRAHGLGAFADSLETRNAQIRNERLDEREANRRLERLAAQRAS